MRQVAQSPAKLAASMLKAMMQGTDQPARCSATRSHVCRLLAHYYCMHVTLLTVGTRIGSSAAEKLGLFQAQAVHAWRSYPAEAGRNPVATLMASINTAGEQLGPSQLEVVLEELPDAFLKASVLLRCLAYED